MKEFLKMKLEEFSEARDRKTAKDWIARLEKIFRSIDCLDDMRVRLAEYKLASSEERWWIRWRSEPANTQRYATLAWNEFKEILLEHYYPATERRAVVREYAMIEQHKDESVKSFIDRFRGLVEHMRTSAGTHQEQAEKFAWTLRDEIRDKISSRLHTLEEVEEEALHQKQIVIYCARRVSGSVSVGSDQKRQKLEAGSQSRRLLISRFWYTYFRNF